MSRVTSILLTVGIGEDGFDPEERDTSKIDSINAFLDQIGAIALSFLTPHIQGWKHPGTLTFGGGYNHFPEQAFLAKIQSFEWEFPENVVLVMQPEEGDTLVWRPAF